MTSFDSQFFSVPQEEKKKDYLWAIAKLLAIWTPDARPKVIVTDKELALMGALDEVMAGSANILCTWHINKNVLAKCKRMFSSGEEWDEFISQWNCLISSSSVDEYERQWKKFCTSISASAERSRLSIVTWLIHKERFINAWTSKHMHFGNTSTSRVEGSHAYIKKFLQTSTGDLLTMFLEKSPFSR
ncbi:MULE transposase domain [Plasmopara halstedii]|uniref:MULE transposase domain n=1 Tax=Plasmopara halstedii TaxID=4781 RepID=A0A0P1AWX4_PLAHL|nr:MULE transposase domain [Plasmopara halstedii]CEG46318.1 MULE transposase domain [Plasmopara halstedii]|eukprot:XP_024582687.1 MULE transposase domain [Plasmopara halstedii]